MSPQTSYPTDPKAGRPGLIADLSNYSSQSMRSETAIPFGTGVKKGADADLVAVLSLAADMLFKNFGGVAVSSFDKPNSSTGIATHPADVPFAVLTKGPVHVLLDQAVVPTDKVFCRFEVNPGVNELVSLTPDGTAATGSYKINWNSIATELIDWDATEAEIQAAIDDAFGEDVMVVTGDLSDPAITLEFVGAYALTDVSAVTITDNTLETVAPAAIVLTVAVEEVGQPIGDVVGAFRKDADDADGAKAAEITYARWRTAGAKGETAVLELSHPR